MLYGWKENSMLTNWLAACAHLTITVSEIERDIGRKSSFFHTHLAFDAPVIGGFPSEHRHPVWYGKTRMVWLPDGEKNLYSFWCNLRTWQTDGRTDRHRMTAIAKNLLHLLRGSVDSAVCFLTKTPESYVARSRGWRSYWLLWDFILME